MYAHHIREFSRQCCARVFAGEALTADEANAWAVLLEARELGGERLLGRFAGDEPSIDTYSGRCGMPVWFRERPGATAGSGPDGSHACEVVDQQFRDR